MTTAIEKKLERGEELTTDELATLSPAAQAEYWEQMQEEAEHRAEMANTRALLADTAEVVA